MAKKKKKKKKNYFIFFFFFFFFCQSFNKYVIHLFDSIKHIKKNIMALGLPHLCFLVVLWETNGS